MPNMKEGAYNPFAEAQATLSPTYAEKRLTALLEALVSACDEADKEEYRYCGWKQLHTDDVRRMILSVYEKD